MNQLLQRTITAAVLIGMFIFVEMNAATAPQLLVSFAAVVWIGAFRECIALAHSASGRYAVVATLVIVAGMIAPKIVATPSSIAVLTCVAALGIALLGAGRSATLDGTSRLLLVTAIGGLVFGLGGVGLLSVVSDPLQNRALSVWLVGLVVVTDIGAYGFGRAIGGAKLAPSISPGKTVAGAVGAIALCALVGPTLAEEAGVHAPALHSTLAALVISIASQCGDLLESLLKRFAGAKDSGSLLPGHGGIYDRVDGLLAAAAILPFLMG